MTRPLNRREVLAALAATLSAPLAFAETPATGTPPPAGSARYVVEVLAFRPPGPVPKAYPVPHSAKPKRWRAVSMCSAPINTS